MAYSTYWLRVAAFSSFPLQHSHHDHSPSLTLTLSLSVPTAPSSSSCWCERFLLLSWCGLRTNEDTRKVRRSCSACVWLRKNFPGLRDLDRIQFHNDTYTYLEREMATLFLAVIPVLLEVTSAQQGLLRHSEPEDSALRTTKQPQSEQRVSYPRDP